MAADNASSFGIVTSRRGHRWSASTGGRRKGTLHQGGILGANPSVVTVRAFGGLEVVLRIVKDVALKKRRDALPEIDTPRLFAELAQPFTGKAKIAGGDETVKCEV